MTPEEEKSLQKAQLEKAKSAGHHIERMKKAVSSFHDTVTKLSKAHHDDMHKAFGQLHKILGTGTGDQSEIAPGGGGEPEARNLTSDGTTNLQDFGKMAEAMKAAGYVVTAPDPSTKETFTKAEVTSLMEKSNTDLMRSFLEVLVGKAKGGAPAVCPDCDEKMEDCKCAKVTKAEPSAGIGNRTQLSEPVRRVANAEIFKATDGMPNLQPHNGVTTASATTDAAREDLVRKAANGDTAAALELMKGAKPSSVPATLVDSLSKIH